MHCGLNDNSLSNSIAQIKHVARDIDTLSQNLNEMDTIDLPVDKLVDGKEMSMRIT